MKKNPVLFLSVLMMLALLVSACAGNNSAASGSDTASEATRELTAEDSSPESTTAPEEEQVDEGEQPDENPPDEEAQSDAASASISGAYTVDGESMSESGQSYTASGTDESAILVTNSGDLTLTNATISSSGTSSSSDNSSFYGQNAGVLAQSASYISISDSTVTTTGDGANGVFSNGEDTQVTLENVTINCTGQYAHAVMATQGGSMNLNNVNMTTAGANSGAIATDRGSGTIDMEGGSVLTTGSNSPGIYSTGAITVENAYITSSASEAAVIEGANSINLTDTALSSGIEGKWGVMIYQSMSGDAEGTEGSFSMIGGSLAYTSSSGPLFYVTNSTGYIDLVNVAITLNSNQLINAAAGDWGSEGANGGNVVLTADTQALNGEITADGISTVSLTLSNASQWTGAMDTANSAKETSLSLDSTCTWNVTADSYLTVLDDAEGISGNTITNINGNGFTVYYDAAANSALGGQTYSLNGGGYLTPAS
jgi:hypothetical protein